MARTPAPAQPELPNTKPKKARKPKPVADSPAPWAYRFVAFGDLHVSAKTLDRCVDVLRRVGEAAKENQAFIVCLGDFWHQRASLNVRQLDAVLTVFGEWKEMGIPVFMIPGNHDQVSLDGAVHAVRVFEPFANVTIVTEPMIWEEQKIAFLPWREREGEQDALFSQLEGEGWTVFTHAEIEGATNNQAHQAKGRVGLDRIVEKARAVYAGHYHKRQQLGDRSWYVGSPFEMDFGERDMPHGVALITPETIVPAFLDFDDMPKHIRVEWSEDGSLPQLDNVRDNDIVEFHASHDTMRKPSFLHVVAGLKAKDVRFVSTRDANPAEANAAPAFALSVESAIDVWVNESTADLKDETKDAKRAELSKRAREVLAEVADSRTIVPFSSKVRICQVDIENFCAVRGLLSWDVRSLGPTLLQGPMGAGKTSICDAITWGLYGVTTPRKANGGSLKADAVIHDEADASEVHVTLALAMPEGERLVTVTRTKKRGKGATIRITGMDEAEGIADQQALIHRIVGLDIDLWRACVYLGQGEVENFVVSADKRRKELLSRAFNLSACEGAVKVARTKSKDLVASRQKLQITLASNQSALDALASVDFSAQALQWDAQVKAKQEGFAQVIANETAKIAQFDPHLASEDQWKTTKVQYEAHLDALTKSLASSSSETQLQQAAAQLGSYNAELMNTRKKLTEAESRLSHINSKSSAPACFHCNQPIDPERYAIQAYEAEQAVVQLRQQVAHYEAHVGNLQAKIGELRAGGDSGRTEMQEQIAQTRDAISKCGEALSTLAGMRLKREEAERLIKSAQHEAMALATGLNPFAAKAKETEEKIAVHRQALSDAEQATRIVNEDIWYMERIEEMFGAKGIPVLVLRTVLHELETQANRFLATLLAGKIHCRLTMRDEDLDIEWFEWSAEKNAHVERDFLQLSGGQRRCAEMAFSPFALSEMIFARCGVRVPFLVVDELTTHLDVTTKPVVCELLRELDRETIIVIDHDTAVRGEFDTAIEVRQDADCTRISKVEVAG